MLQRALGLLGNVDLSFLEALDEVVRGEVYKLNRVCAIEHLVGDGLAHAHAGDLRDDVIQAFDVLDVDRGIDVDAVVDEFFDVEIAFRVAAARRIGVGEFVDESELRAARDDRVDIHLIEGLSPVIDVLTRNDLEAVEQHLGFPSAMRFDNSDDEVHAFLLLGARRLQHFEGLADPWRGADEYLQFSGAPFLAPGCFKQGVGRRPLIGILPTVLHLGADKFLVRATRYGPAARSNAKFKASTFTRGSPRMPRSRCLTCALTNRRTRSSGRFRAFATRGT